MVTATELRRPTKSALQAKQERAISAYGEQRQKEEEAQEEAEYQQELKTYETAQAKAKKDYEDAVAAANAPYVGKVMVVTVGEKSYNPVTKETVRAGTYVIPYNKFGEWRVGMNITSSYSGADVDAEGNVSSKTMTAQIKRDAEIARVEALKQKSREERGVITQGTGSTPMITQVVGGRTVQVPITETQITQLREAGIVSPTGIQDTRPIPTVEPSVAFVRAGSGYLGMDEGVYKKYQEGRRQEIAVANIFAPQLKGDNVPTIVSRPITYAPKEPTTFEKGLSKLEEFQQTISKNAQAIGFGIAKEVGLPIVGERMKPVENIMAGTTSTKLQPTFFGTYKETPIVKAKSTKPSILISQTEANQKLQQSFPLSFNPYETKFLSVVEPTKPKPPRSVVSAQTFGKVFDIGTYFYPPVGYPRFVLDATIAGGKVATGKAGFGEYATLAFVGTALLTKGIIKARYKTPKVTYFKSEAAPATSEFYGFGGTRGRALGELIQTGRVTRTEIVVKVAGKEKRFNIVAGELSTFGKKTDKITEFFTKKGYTVLNAKGEELGTGVTATSGLLGKVDKSLSKVISNAAVSKSIGATSISKEGKIVEYALLDKSISPRYYERIPIPNERVYSGNVIVNFGKPTRYVKKTFWISKGVSTIDLGKKTKGVILKKGVPKVARIHYNQYLGEAYEARGVTYTNKKLIVIDDLLSPQQKKEVLLHELQHVYNPTQSKLKGYINYFSGRYAYQLSKYKKLVPNIKDRLPLEYYNKWKRYGEVQSELFRLNKGKGYNINNLGEGYTEISKADKTIKLPSKKRVIEMDMGKTTVMDIYKYPKTTEYVKKPVNIVKLTENQRKIRKGFEWLEEAQPKEPPKIKFNKKVSSDIIYNRKGMGVVIEQPSEVIIPSEPLTTPPLTRTEALAIIKPYIDAGQPKVFSIFSKAGGASVLLQRNEPMLKSRPIQTQALGLIQLSKEKQIVSPKPIEIQKTFGMQENKLIQRAAQTPILKEIQKPVQKEVQKTVQKTIQPTTTTTILKTPTTTTTVIVPPSIPSVKTKKEAFGFGIKKGYKVLLKEKGKFKEQRGIFPKGKAIKLGATLTKQRLASTFKIQPTKQTVGGMDIDFTPSKKEFRSYQVVRGKQVPLKDTWIELREKRLTTRAEKGAFVKAKRQSKGGGWW